MCTIAWRTQPVRCGQGCRSRFLRPQACSSGASSVDEQIIWSGTLQCWRACLKWGLHEAMRPWGCGVGKGVGFSHPSRSSHLSLRARILLSPPIVQLAPLLKLSVFVFKHGQRTWWVLDLSGSTRTFRFKLIIYRIYPRIIFLHHRITVPSLSSLNVILVPFILCILWPQRDRKSVV